MVANSDLSDARDDHAEKMIEKQDELDHLQTLLDEANGTFAAAEQSARPRRGRPWASADSALAQLKSD
eukprot:1118188-Prymnesium_polylepis.1